MRKTSAAGPKQAIQQHVAMTINAHVKKIVTKAISMMITELGFRRGVLGGVEVPTLG